MFDLAVSCCILILLEIKNLLNGTLLNLKFILFLGQDVSHVNYKVQPQSNRRKSKNSKTTHQNSLLEAHVPNFGKSFPSREDSHKLKQDAVNITEEGKRHSK